MSSVRLKPEIDKKLREVAALKRLTISEAHREALEAYCEREMAPPRVSRYADVIGIYDSGVGDESVRAHEIFGEIMKKKYGQNP